MRYHLLLSSCQSVSESYFFRFSVYIQSPQLMRIHWGKWGRWPHLPQFLEFTWGLCWVGVSWDLRVTHPLRVGRFYLDLALPRWSTGGCHSWNRLLLSVQPSCGRNTDSYVEFCLIYFQLLLTGPKQLSALADRFKRIEEKCSQRKNTRYLQKYLFKLAVYSKNVSLRLQSSMFSLKVFDTWSLCSFFSSQRRVHGKKNRQL